MRHGTSPVSGSRTGLLAAAASTLGLLALASCSELPARDRPAPPHDLRITTVDFSYLAPDTVPAGLTRIRLSNHGREQHHAQLARVHAGHTIAQLRDTLSAGILPRWVTFVGGPNVPGIGRPSEVVVSLTPGLYAVLCLVPSADGVAHVARGMIRELTVLPDSPGDQAEPAADARMVLDDYGFALSPGLSAGRRTIRVENRGPQVHEVELVRLRPGRTAEDVLAWLRTERGPAPGEPYGGAVALEPGQVNYVTLDLDPGIYALLCFVPDTGDSRPHVAHGMVGQIRVR